MKSNSLIYHLSTLLSNNNRLHPLQQEPIHSTSLALVPNENPNGVIKTKLVIQAIIRAQNGSPKTALGGVAKGQSK